MAPGHIKKLFRSLPLVGGSGSRRFPQGDAGGPTPEATTEAAAAAAGDVASPAPARIETTSQENTSSQPAYRLDSKVANEYMKNIKRFRVLVMGRANAGKTTILQRVCNSTDGPEIFDGWGNKVRVAVVQGTLTRGYHDIKHELVFRSNPGFVFHDSCGFEAGSAEQFEQMKEFVVDRATTRGVNERVHAIWFCIPMTESHRTVTAAELKFFNECDTKHVPVMVLLTKCDSLELEAIEELEDEGLEIEEAQEKIAEKERELLERWHAHIKHELDKCRYLPRGYVTLQKMHQESADCTVLIQSTANVMNEEGLQRLLISTQQSNILLCVHYAVWKTLRQYMELSDSDRNQVIMKKYQLALLAWFPNCNRYAAWLAWDENALFGHFRGDAHGDFIHDPALNELPSFDVDVDIQMPPLSSDVSLLGTSPTVQSIATHAIGCLLVAEYSYFLMLHGNHLWKEVLPLAAEEYQTSDIQLAISEAVQAVFHDYNGDMDDLCEGIFKVVVENRMSNKLFMKPGAMSV